MEKRAADFPALPIFLDPLYWYCAVPHMHYDDIFARGRKVFKQTAMIAQFYWLQNMYCQNTEIFSKLNVITLQEYIYIYIYSFCFPIKTQYYFSALPYLMWGRDRVLLSTQFSSNFLCNLNAESNRFNAVCSKYQTTHKHFYWSDEILLGIGEVKNIFAAATASSAFTLF